MEDDGIDAIPGKSEAVYFCYSTIHPILPVISKLSQIFIKADLGVETQDVSIFIPMSAIAKFKSQDKETSYDRLVYLINNFKIPKNPMRITIYAHYVTVNQTWDYHHLWELKYQHDPYDKIMTFHYPEPKMTCLLEPSVHECFKVAETYAKENGYTIKKIDYTMKYSDVIDLLTQTRVHVSYTGASYYLAGLTNTPTIGFGHKNHWGTNVWESPLISSENILRSSQNVLKNEKINYSIDTIDPVETITLLEKYK